MWKNKAEPAWQPARLEESAGELAVPGQGWYHIHTLRAAPPAPPLPPEQEVFPVEGETLALVLLDIGAYRSRDIPPEALERLGNILAYFKARGQDVILRAAYDAAGRGLEREPGRLDQVFRHMEQLGPVVARAREGILLLQGVLVGSWGEMHGSKFLAPAVMARLLDVWDQATGGGFYLAVRTPAQWREAVVRTARPDLPRRLALFNDGLFGSPTDLGTYGDSRGARRRELDWQRETLACVPNGGEALCAGEGPIDYKTAAGELAQICACYLNSAYQREVLDHWKAQRVKGRGCWAGVSGYDYIGRRLGGRFTVREAGLSGGVLRITVENVGFGSICRPARWVLTAVYPDGSREDRELPGWEPALWPGGAANRLEAGLEGFRAPAELYLSLRLADGRPVPLANTGTEEALGHGVLLGKLKQAR